MWVLYEVAERNSNWKTAVSSDHAALWILQMLTLCSGCHTRMDLSIPVAPSRFPSQLQATWVMECGDDILMSRGRKAENVGAWKGVEILLV